MQNQQNIDKMTALKLAGMAECYRMRHADPAFEALSFDEGLGQLLDAEQHEVEQRRYGRLQRAAKLKLSDACVEAIDYTVSRGVKRSVMANLNACSWVDKANNVIFTGPTGTGKSYLACALGNQCLRRGLSVLYIRLPRMLEALAIARADGSLAKLRQTYAKPKLLIIDDFGLTSINHQESSDLLEVTEDRYNTGSLLMTSQVPCDQWLNYIEDPTVADAIMDRVIHRSHIVNLKGESMRKLQSSIKEDA